MGDHGSGRGAGGMISRGGIWIEEGEGGKHDQPWGSWIEGGRGMLSCQLMVKQHVSVAMTAKQCFPPSPAGWLSLMR